MANPTQERFCPFCEQIVHRDQDCCVVVGRRPFPVKMFHIGCAEIIFDAYAKCINENEDCDES